ncbi:Transcription-associated protein 1 [Frankliniella fusca]|uniref:Regulatory protein zeste n=1 Tax=Frankliniella fusca TaxID=407009 RepID=A0AAE1HA23_9NEOP|nr:Transcription-associated protein 1 [Frankliniella fusca]
MWVRCQASEEQWMVLLDHIQTDEELLTGRFLQPNGAIRVPQKWNELATVLNSVKPGTQKSGNEWKSAWANLRSRARTAYREKVRYMAGTGGGPAPEIVGLGLNRVYERVIDLTGTTAAVGTKCPNPLQVVPLDQGKRCLRGCATPSSTESQPSWSYPTLFCFKTEFAPSCCLFRYCAAIPKLIP